MGACGGWQGTALIVIGATVAVSFGDHSEKCFTLSELMELYQQAGMLVYLIIVVALLVVMYLVVKRCEKLLAQPYVDLEDVTRAFNDDGVASASPSAHLPRIPSGVALDAERGEAAVRGYVAVAVAVAVWLWLCGCGCGCVVVANL